MNHDGGSSFSFEDVLLREGVELRYLARGEREAIYRSTLETGKAGGFGGPLIVSMRPLRPADAIRAIEATARYPLAHGAPVHIGKPESIGVNLREPMETLGRTSVQDDELPLFWACGVTVELAIRKTAPDRAGPLHHPPLGPHAGDRHSHACAARPHGGRRAAVTPARIFQTPKSVRRPRFNRESGNSDAGAAGGSVPERAAGRHPG